MRANQSSFVLTCRVAFTLLLLIVNLSVIQGCSALRPAARVEGEHQLDSSNNSSSSFIGSNYGISLGRKLSDSKGSESASTKSTKSTSSKSSKSTESSKSSYVSDETSSASGGQDIEEASATNTEEASATDTEESSATDTSDIEESTTLDSDEGESALGIISEEEEEEEPIGSGSDESSSVKVAHVGNSMQYYGDTPRFLQHMLQTSNDNVIQNSCLRPASTLWSVWTRGNNMGERFNSTAALQDDGTLDIGAPTVKALLEEEEWDYVVLNDRTQNPTREDSRNKSLGVLEDEYAKALDKSSVILFIQTPAYRLEGIRDTEDLGDFDEFTERVRDGVQKYIDLMQELGFEAKMAPVGDVYARIRAENRESLGQTISY